MSKKASASKSPITAPQEPDPPRHEWTGRIAKGLRERGVAFSIEHIESDDRVRAMGARDRSVSVDADGWVSFWEDDPVLTEVLTHSFFLSDDNKDHHQLLDEQLHEIAQWLVGTMHTGAP